jgi:secreted trypsin-like serine protease
MTNTRAMTQDAFRLIVAVGAIAGIAGAGCDASDAADDALDETESALANARPAGGAGVVHLQISDLVLDRNGFVKIVDCTGTLISGNRIVTAGHCFDAFLTIKDGSDQTVFLQGDLFANVGYTQDGTNFVCLTNTTQAVCGDESYAPVHVSRLGNSGLPPDVAVVRLGAPLPVVRKADFRLLSTADVRVRQSVEEWGAGLTNAAGTAGAEISPAMMRAVVRIAAVAATTVKVPDNVSQVCKGDSGGPLFAGPSDLVVGVLSKNSGTGKCAGTTAQTTASRITPTVINFINNNRAGADPACHETIASSGFFSCS